MKTLDRAQSIAHLRELIEKSDPDSELFENPNRHAKFVQQLERLVRLLEEEETATPTLAQISDFVFPGLKDSSRRTAFASFRTLLSKAAAEVGHTFECIQPDQRGSDKHGIRCRFEGRALPTEPELRKTTRRATAGIDRNDFVLANPPFAAMKSAEMAKVVKGQLPRDQKGRIPIRFFVSYTRKDSDAVDRLLDKLRYDLDASENYSFEFWKDTRIPLGETWHEEIQSALEECDIGLALVSPGFFSTDYITDHELPVLVSGEKPLIPIAVKPIDFDRHDLHGLEAKQIFRFEENGRFRAFSECRQGVADRFIHALARKVEERAEASVQLRSQALLMQTMEDPEKAKALLERFPEFREIVNRQSEISRKKSRHNQKKPLSVVELRRLSQRVSDQFPTADKIEPTIGAGGLEDVTKIVRKSHLHDQEANPYERFREHRRLAIDYLRDWLRDPGSAPFAAVLGEVGSGKTTMLQLLAKAVGEDPEEPPVIFIDLRDYQGTKELTLEKILSEYLRRYDPEKKLTAADIVDAVQTRNALVIFDGLDEKIISMSEAERHGFIRELWRILPVEAMDRSVGEGRGRMIISCRSHYFPTIQSLNSGYVAQDRQGVKTQDYVACVMLPWEAEQVEEYLRLALGEENVEAALETIASVHNLTDLSQRPYLLNLITPELESLQLEQAAGLSVNAAALYEKFIERWLRRDEGKHVFTIEHKRLLMEQLAADLWRDGDREWPWERVAEWLDQFLYDHPVIADRYQRDGVSTSTLAQDFRTVTFFLRPDASENGFRFAHTSLQEFFLASHIFRSFEKGVEEGIAAVDLPEPSLETFAFLGQLVARLPERRRKGVFEHFAAMMADRDAPKDSRRNGLLAYLLGVEDGDPLPNCSFLAANDLDLSDWSFSGERQKPIVLPEIDFSGAALLRVSFEDIKFAPLTNWEKADIRNAEFCRCTIGETNWSENLIKGALFRECEIPSSFAQWEKSVRFQKCSGVQASSPGKVLDTQPQIGHSSIVSSVALSPNGALIISGSWDNSLRLWDTTSGQCIRHFEGHSNMVWTAAFSPDGSQIVSGSDDKTLRLWEATSGKCIRVFEGHSQSVLFVAFSPDAKRIISASDDSLLKMWEVETGQCIRTFRGHSSSATTVAFTPDSSKIVSGSWDNTVKVWNSISGECLNTLEGHSRRIRSVAISPDGSKIASGSDDNTLRIWDPRNFQCLSSLEVHSSSVTSISFSPDSSCLVTGSWDNTVAIWNSISGRCIKKLEGHTDRVWSVAFSPDGSLIASGSSDRTLRVWDATTGQCVTTITGHFDMISSFALSPDESLIATGSADGRLRIWDAVSGKSLRILKGASGSMKDLAFSPDGKIVGGRNAFHVGRAWNLAGDSVDFPTGRWTWDENTDWHRRERSKATLSLSVRSIIGKEVDGKLSLRFFALPDGNSIVLHPWDDEEARKPAHECRWKLVSGPEDAWRYVSAIDRETGESYAPEYCTENGTWEIT